MLLFEQMLRKLFKSEPISLGQYVAEEDIHAVNNTHFSVKAKLLKGLRMICAEMTYTIIDRHIERIEDDIGEVKKLLGLR